MKSKILSQYREQIMGRGTVQQFIEIKKRASISDLLKCFEVFGNTQRRQLEWGNLHPKRVCELYGSYEGSMKMVYSMAKNIEEQRRYLESDFCYALAVMIYNKEKINQFICQRQRYEKLLFLGRFEEAVVILDDIERDIGVSIWGIQARFVLFEMAKIVEYGNNYYSSFDYYQLLKSKLSETGSVFVDTIIRIIMEKSNSSTDSRQFSDRFEQIVSAASEATYVQQYQIRALQVYLSMITSQKERNRITQNENSIGDQLALFNNIGLIDRYILLEYVLSAYFVDSRLNKYRFSRRFINEIEFSYLNINSSMLRNILLSYGSENIGASLSREETANAFSDELYITLNTGKSIEELCNRYIEKGVDLFDIIIASAQYDQISSKEKPYKVIVDTIRQIYNAELQNEYAISAIDTLDRMNRVLLGTEIGYGLTCFAENELYSTEENARTSRLYAALRREKLSFESFEILYDYEGNMNTSSACCLKQFAYKWYYSALYLKCFNAGIINEMKTDEVIIECHAYQEWTLEKLESLVSYIMCKGNRTIQEAIKNSRASQELFKRYSKEKKWYSTARLYFNEYLCSQVYSAKINYQLLSRSLSSNEIGRFGGDYYFADFIYMTDVLSRQRNPRDSDRAYKCYSQALNTRKVNKPSKLRMPEEPGEREAYLFYLRNVCSIEMLGRDTERFDSDEERIIERLAIVEQLLNDQRYSERYGAELKRERDNLSIKLENHLLADILNSKIDLSRIDTATCDDAIIKTYNKLLCISREKSDEWLYEFRNGLLVYCKNYAKQLDEMIGMNIRHAFFGAEIREVFQRHGFISYDNQIDSTLYKFTKNIHEVIAKYSQPRQSDWMVVTEKDNKNAMSLYFTEDEVTQYLKSELTSGDGLRELYKTILDTKAKEVLKSKSTKMLDEISDEISDQMKALYGRPGFYECVADLTACLHTVQEWFSPGTNNDIHITFASFSEQMRRRYASIENITFLDEFLKGIRLDKPIIVGLHLVFCNLIRNAEKHSGFSDSKDAHLRISISYNAKRSVLCLCFVNKLCPNLTKERVQRIISENRDRLASADNGEKTSNDIGKTGYIKIRNWFQRYYGDSPRIDIYFDEEKWEYVVLIDMDWDYSQGGMICEF